MRPHPLTFLSPLRYGLFAFPLFLVACPGGKDTGSGSEGVGEEGGGSEGGGIEGGGSEGGGSEGGGSEGGGSEGGGSEGGGSEGGGSEGGGSEGGGSEGGGTDADGDGSDATDDCDDHDDSVYPGADEVCDGQDNDCDDEIDEDPTDGGLYAPDDDGDGLGAQGDLVLACEGVDNTWDCNDSNANEPQVVDIAATARGDGSLALPWSVIQDGIDAADECVLVFPGLYEETIDFSGKDIVVASVAGPEATVINGGGLVAPVVSFTSGEGPKARLSGFTLTGGSGQLTESEDTYSCGSGDTCTNYYSTWCGGGIYMSDSSPSIEDVLVVDNTLPENSTTTSGDDTFYTQSFGGGMCLLNASPVLTRSHFWANYADQGGAVYVDEDSIVEHRQSQIGSNYAVDGAGVAVDGGTLILVNVVGVWNEATEEGGMVLGLSGTVQLLNTTLAGNSSALGAGLQLTGTTDGTLVNSIVYGSTSGYGIVLEDTAKLRTSYNNVYGNYEGEFAGMSDVTGSDGNISVDPKFTAYSDDGDPSNDDYTLKSTSPSVDAGDPSSAFNDADGSTNDQGAYGGPNSDWASGS